MSSTDTHVPTATAARGRRTLRAVLLTVAGVVVVTLVSVGLSPIGQRFLEDADGAPPVTGVDTVEIADSRFVQASIEVPVGATVTWAWTDGESHDVVFADGGAASEIRADGTWSRAFEDPGEHRYRCTLHPFMEGRVVVTDR